MHHDVPSPSPLPPPLLCVREAADRLGVSVSFLNQARRSGQGPAYLKLGRRVLYARADLDAWLDGLRRTSTREAADA